MVLNVIDCSQNISSLDQSVFTWYTVWILVAPQGPGLWMKPQSELGKAPPVICLQSSELFAAVRRSI